MARPRTELGCVRCQRTGVKHGANFPEGRICRRCYQRALCRRGPCSSCHETRLVPGQTETGLLLCRDCADIIQDFHCRQCGEEDEPQREGRCARCCLRELLAGILDDGHGAVNDRLLPLHEAICAQARPRSAIIWLRNPGVRRLLSDLATGRLPIEYASFEAHSSPKTATHLRDLLVEHGVLDPVNRDLALFEGWLARTLPTIDDPDHQALLRRYATWHHLRRTRTLAAAGRLRPGYIDTSRQAPRQRHPPARRPRRHPPQPCPRDATRRRRRSARLQPQDRRETRQ
jgi:hypothetical protein